MQFTGSPSSVSVVDWGVQFTNGSGWNPNASGPMFNGINGLNYGPWPSFASGAQNFMGSNVFTVSSNTIDERELT